MKRGELLPCELCGKPLKPYRTGLGLHRSARCPLSGLVPMTWWNRLQRTIAAYGAKAYALGLGAEVKP